MEIAPATVADADAVTDLWVALAAEQTDYGSHVQAASNRGVVRDEVTRRAVTDRLLVARTEGDDDPPDDVVGFVMFGIDRGNYEMAVTQGVVQNIYVAPGYRDDGVGSDLLAAAERRLGDLGADTVALETMAENLQARRFYRRHGYDQHRVKLEKALENDSHSKEGG